VIHINHAATSNNFLAPLPGTEEEEAPTLTTFSHVNYTPATIFWRRCRGKRRLLQGEFRTHILYFVLSFAFTLFLLASFHQKQKKLDSFIVAFIYLLLVLLE
jgi:hypothetical protein